MVEEIKYNQYIYGVITHLISIYLKFQRKSKYLT